MTDPQSGKVTGVMGVEIIGMNRPGTIIWNDPTTGEERFTAPGTRMYQTALMHAGFFIDKNGERQKY